jgi:hypothetical protein
VNFGDLWQEHRKYLTAVVAGAVGVLVVKLIIGLVYDDRIRKAGAKLERARADGARALPAGVDPAAVRRSREDLEAKFTALRASLHRKPREEMTLGAAANDPDLHYNAQIDRVRNGVLELCALRNIDVDPRLGLPEAFPTSRGDFQHYLRGLDAVEQIIAICLAAEQRVEGGIARIERLDIEKAAKAKAGAARGKAFLSTLGVDAVIIGHPRALDDVLRTFSAPDVGEGRRLIVQEASLKSLDVAPGAAARDRRGADPLDLRRAELRVRLLALDIDPEGKL